MSASGSATPGISSASATARRAAGASTAGTCTSSSTRSVRTMRKSGAPSSYAAPSVAITSASRPAIGARSANAFPAAAPPPWRSVSSRWASRASAARRRASAIAKARRASSTRRAGTALSASNRSARASSACAPSTATRASAPSASKVALSAPVVNRGSRRASTWPARTRSPIEGSASALIRPAAGADTIASPPGSGCTVAGARTDARTSAWSTMAVANGLVHCCSFR